MDRNMKILIVDDNASMRRILKNILEHLGFKHIFEADDGKLAKAHLKINRFGLVITDWNMPHMSGFQLLETIRKDNELKDTPVMMVTAEGTKENIVAAIKAGVNSYVVKPFDLQTIEDKLEKLFSEQ